LVGTMDHWYAIQVSGRQELPIASLLRHKGYEEFVPVYIQRRNWADRVKQVTAPLFKGYVFCRLNLGERLLPLLTTPGVIRIVGAGRSPIPIDDAEINSLQTAVASGAPLEPFPDVAVGQRVLLTEGPLSGCEGIIVETKKAWRLVVSITLLQRSVAVEIDRCWAHVISTASAPRRPAEAASALGPPIRSALSNPKMFSAWRS
jgi:transcription antitermination factor NusG